MFEKQLSFGYFAISFKNLHPPPILHYNWWLSREMCGGNIAMWKTWLLSRLIRINKLTILSGSSAKCGTFFPSSRLGRRAAQIFVKWIHPSISQGNLFPIAWRAACGFLRRVACVCTLNIHSLQVILSSLTLGLCFSKIDSCSVTQALFMSLLKGSSRWEVTWICPPLLLY